MRTALILFILLGFPVLEIFTLVQLADLIGWWLLAWVVGSALAGGLLLREAGFAIPARLFAALQAGHSLNFALLDSFRTVLAALLLIFPGVVSDFLALILLLLPHPKPSRPSSQMPGNDGVIEGEWREAGDGDEHRRLR
ncbi:MAG: FxsA family protein [Pseudomonadota bacterium]|jgi:UPF0716 protein FxsA